MKIRFFIAGIISIPSSIFFLGNKKTFSQTIFPQELPAYVYEDDISHRHYSPEPLNYQLNGINIFGKKGRSYSKVRFGNQLQEVTEQREKLIQEEINHFKQQREELLKSFPKSSSQ
ncbi:MAG: hypothetical protein ACFBSE_01800 [Prochloraceae cyanobacterium]